MASAPDPQTSPSERSAAASSCAPLHSALPSVALSDPLDRQTLPARSAETSSVDSQQALPAPSGWRAIGWAASIVAYSNNTWSTLGNCSFMMIGALAATTPAAFRIAALSAGVHAVIGAFAMRNEFREYLHLGGNTAKDGVDPDTDKIHFRSGLLRYPHALINSPGIRWTALSATFAVNTLSQLWFQNPVEALMFFGFATGCRGAAIVENRKFLYWERYEAWRTGAEVADPRRSASVVDRLFNTPGISWCVADGVAGMYALTPALLFASWPAMSFAGVGLTLAAIGATLALVGAFKKEPEDSKGPPFLPTLLAGIQNLAFAGASAAVGSWMALPLFAWGISTSLVALNIRENARSNSRT